MKSALLLVVLFCIVSFVEAQNPKNANEAKATIYEFYQQYIIQSENSPLDRMSGVQDSLLKIFCTKNLIERLNADVKSGRLDWDPFLKAQDIDVGWLKTLQVKDDSSAGWYVISFLEEYTQRWIHVRLRVEKENGEYKISEIDY
jgi:hypothetical protein